MPAIELSEFHDELRLRPAVRHRRHGLLHERAIDDLDAIGILERAQVLERRKASSGRCSHLPSIYRLRMTARRQPEQRA